MYGNSRFCVRPCRRAFVLGLMLAFIGTSSANLFGDVAYLRSTAGLPWGVGVSDPGSNEAAMDTVFGSGNWSDLRYETVDVSLLFSSTNTFIFLEGGDDNADELEYFLTTNEALITNWVSDGGNLFLNAAPNEGDGMSFGFGISLNYNGVEPTHSDNVIAVDSSHIIFNGPFGETGSSFTGGNFSHATVSGDGLNPLIIADDITGIVLGEMNYGNGHILFGGMTLSNFHEPKPESNDLLANILAYGAGITSPIPEPSAYAILSGSAFFALVLVRRRRSK